jgi:hypothetical protein
MKILSLFASIFAVASFSLMGACGPELPESCTATLSGGEATCTMQTNDFYSCTCDGSSFTSPDFCVLPPDEQELQAEC